MDEVRGEMSQSVTNEEMIAALSDDRILTFDESALPQDMTNLEARRTLSDVGLPEGMSQSFLFDPTVDFDRFHTLNEIDDRVHATGVASLYFLGMWGDSHYIAVDGVRGDVLAVESGQRMTRLAGDLYRFATMLLLVKKSMNENVRYISDEGLAEMKDRLISLFSSVDPDAVGDSEEIWRDMIDNVVHD